MGGAGVHGGAPGGCRYPALTNDSKRAKAGGGRGWWIKLHLALCARNYASGVCNSIWRSLVPTNPIQVAHDAHGSHEGAHASQPCSLATCSHAKGLFPSSQYMRLTYWPHLPLRVPRPASRPKASSASFSSEKGLCAHKPPTDKDQEGGCNTMPLCTTHVTKRCSIPEAVWPKDALAARGRRRRSSSPPRTPHLYKRYPATG